jgi:hypothetical protein
LPQTASTTIPSARAGGLSQSETFRPALEYFAVVGSGENGLSPFGIGYDPLCGNGRHLASLI